MPSCGSEAAVKLLAVRPLLHHVHAAAFLAAAPLPGHAGATHLRSRDGDITHHQALAQRTDDRSRGTLAARAHLRVVDAWTLRRS